MVEVVNYEISKKMDQFDHFVRINWAPESQNSKNNYDKDKYYLIIVNIEEQKSTKSKNFIEKIIERDQLMLDKNVFAFLSWHFRETAHLWCFRSNNAREIEVQGAQEHYNCFFTDFKKKSISSKTTPNNKIWTRGALAL